jgi:hypothetical protein
MRVLRIVEYLYKDAQLGSEDMMHWHAPANGTKKFNDWTIVRSAVMGSEFKYMDEAASDALLELESLKEMLFAAGIQTTDVGQGVKVLIDQRDGLKEAWYEARQKIDGAAPDYVYTLINALAACNVNVATDLDVIDFRNNIIPPEVDGYLCSRGIRFKYRNSQSKGILGKEPDQ